jgi:hypothetical protein
MKQLKKGEGVGHARTTKTDDGADQQSIVLVQPATLIAATREKTNEPLLANLPAQLELISSVVQRIDSRSLWPFISVQLPHEPF